MDDRFDYEQMYYFYDMYSKIVMGVLISPSHSIEEIEILVEEIANTKEVTLMMNGHDRLHAILSKLGEKGVIFEFKMRLGYAV